MIHYVLGFLFSDDRERVVLIKKTHGPADMTGKLNGLGGSINEGESSLAAMVREFEEEAGIRVESWQRFLVMHGPAWDCDVYRAFDTKALSAAKTTTDERVTKEYLVTLPRALYPNLRWMLPMALDDNLLSASTDPQRVYYDTPTILHLSNLVFAKMDPDEKVTLQKHGPKTRKREEARRRRKAIS